MESEKVKEIKECLENCINDCVALSCPYNKYEKGLKCIEDLQKDCLTLINELESENETLRNAKVVYENVDYCAEDLKKAEKRIAEMERKNEKRNKRDNDIKRLRKKYREALKKNAFWESVFNSINEEEYRKKFNDEWRKEYQKELDKQGKGHLRVAGNPDDDLVYKLYFEQKDRIAELEKENETKTDTIVDLLKKQEFYENEKLKQFAERLKEKCEYNRKQYCCEATVSAVDIDETLKEFIK